MTLSPMPGAYAVVRFAPGTRLSPDAFAGEGFVSVTRTADELSVVCESARIGQMCPGAEPGSIESGWNVLKVEGPLDFSLTGVLASLAAPLARASVSVFALSTFDTDYLLVRETDRERALEALRAAGFGIAGD